MFSKDEISDLAVALQGMVIWRGCMAGGKFDEHYNTPEYALYSDEWEPYHIVVTYKPTGQTILRAGTGYCEWYGEAIDYRDLWREVENHNQTLEAMRKEDVIEAVVTYKDIELLTVKGDTPPAKVIWSKGDIQLLWLSTSFHNWV